MKKQDENLKTLDANLEDGFDWVESGEYCPYTYELFGRKEYCSCSPEKRRECAADI